MHTSLRCRRLLPLSVLFAKTAGKSVFWLQQSQKARLQCIKYGGIMVLWAMLLALASLADNVSLFFRAFLNDCIAREVKVCYDKK